MRRTVLAVLLLTAAARPGFAEGVAVQVVSHSGFGQIIVRLPRGTPFAMRREADRLHVSLPGAGTVPGSARPPRNVRRVEGGRDGADIVLAPDARLRATRTGNRVVIDVLDPPKNGAADAGSAKLPGAPASGTPASAAMPAPTPPPVPPQALPAVPVPVREAPLPAPVSEPAATVRPAPASTDPDTAMLIPFGAETGAAAFARGDTAIVVFDERRPIDLAALRASPAFSGAVVDLLPEATVLRLPLAPGGGVGLRRTPDGWIVSARPAAAPPCAMVLTQAGPNLGLAAAGPSKVVAVPDPESGANLLVGTQRGDGQGVLLQRRAPGFILDPSWQGAVVEPLSDRLTLRAGDDGFVLAEAGQALALSAPDAARELQDAARLTRRFDFPDLPDAALLRRLDGQMAAAGAAPPRSRTRPRLAAARTMIALGMGAEAQGMLALAGRDDGRLAADPDAAGLAGIAALLAGRTQDSAGLDDARLTGTDEIALWRAVRAAQLGRRDEAAPVLAAEIRLILSYPSGLRARLLPLAAETMIDGGESAASKALLQARPDDPALAFARALLLARNGDDKAALAAFDALAGGRDRLIGARAAARAVEMRLAAGRLTPAEAASALERHFLDWRGDGREPRLRLRVAELRARAGAWTDAFAALRETEAGWPDFKPQVHAAAAQALRTLLADGRADRVPPLEFAALVEDNASLLDGDAAQQLAPLLADRLAALDLPARAAPVLDRLLRAAAGAARARIGARLAGLRLDQDDAAGALDALARSAAEALPPELLERRALLRARALARSGDPQQAAMLLAAFDGDAARDLRASLLARVKDWTGAETALLAFAAHVVPATGALDAAQQTILLRLATAAAQAGDAAELRQLRDRDAARMTEGKLGDVFRLLVAEPVAGVGDLPRSAAELRLAKSLPADLQALGRAPR